MGNRQALGRQQHAPLRQVLHRRNIHQLLEPFGQQGSGRAGGAGQLFKRPGVTGLFVQGIEGCADDPVPVQAIFDCERVAAPREISGRSGKVGRRSDRTPARGGAIVCLQGHAGPVIHNNNERLPCQSSLLNAGFPPAAFPKS